jgi:hypothetical protein
LFSIIIKILRKLVADKVDWYLDELVAEMERLTGKQASVPTLWRSLKFCGIRRKKVQNMIVFFYTFYSTDFFFFFYSFKKKQEKERRNSVMLLLQEFHVILLISLCFWMKLRKMSELLRVNMAIQ